MIAITGAKPVTMRNNVQSYHHMQAPAKSIWPSWTRLTYRTSCTPMHTSSTSDPMRLMIRPILVPWDQDRPDHQSHGVRCRRCVHRGAGSPVREPRPTRPNALCRCLHVVVRLDVVPHRDWLGPGDRDHQSHFSPP